jgi:hypothetical protein
LAKASFLDAINFNGSRETFRNMRVPVPIMPHRSLTFLPAAVSRNKQFREFSSHMGSSPSFETNLPWNTVVKFVPQQESWVVERFGRFSRILEPGLALLMPFVERIAYLHSLKEKSVSIPAQSAITMDNVTLELDGPSHRFPISLRF